MKFGFVLPGGTASEQLEQAVLADQAGWDGVFVWEAAYGVDAWTLLAAMAARTERVKLGTMLTPLAVAPTLESRQSGRHARPTLERARDPRGRSRRDRQLPRQYRRGTGSQDPRRDDG